MMNSPRMYTDIASWFHLLTAPEEYAEEAAIFLDIFHRFLPEAKTLLELGSGGGNNALYLKKHYRMTLVDLSPQMLELSRGLNPDLDHFQGDMRSWRQERQFDIVFIHDAIMYMTTLEDLRKAMRTAFAHCKPGGIVLIAPDCTRETFQPGTDCGGHDGPERAMRYLEWSWDPDPSDTTYQVEYAYLLRESDGSVSSMQDRHTLGLFSQSEWLEALRAEGFDPHILPFNHSEVEPGTVHLFLGEKH